MTDDLPVQTVTLTKDRSVLSSERAPHKDKTGTRHQDWLTDCLSVAIWLWLWVWRIRHKYKKLKLGSGQAYDHSSDQAAVVA
jgi:hypothetical protein